MNQILLQQIRDKLAGLTSAQYGTMDRKKYLQEIRDLILGATNQVHGTMNELIYLQQIRNAIQGVPDGQFGTMNRKLYLQEIRDAFSNLTVGNEQGSMDDDLYLEDIYDVASIGPLTVTITSTESSPTAVSPVPITFTLSKASPDFAIGSITIGGTAGATLGNFQQVSTLVYTADATPSNSGTILADVAANAFHDAAGNGNDAATQFSVSWFNTSDTLRHNLITGLANYRIAKASGLVSALVLGDSIGFGQGTTDPATKAFTNMIESTIQSDIGDAGSFIADYVPGNEVAQWTLGSGWSAVNQDTSQYGFRGHFQYSSGGGTLSTSLMGTAFEFFCLRGPSTVEHTIQVDSETPITMGAVNGTTIVEKKSISGLSNTSHNIVITPGAGLVIHDGIMIHTGETGLRFCNNSVPGSHFFVMNYPLKLSSAKFADFDLIITVLGMNDYLGQIALATFSSTLNSVLSSYRTYADVLVVIQNYSGISLAIPQSDYIDAIKTSAVANGCAYIDIADLWISYADANAQGWMFDTIHPNDAGHVQMYNELIQWL